ncbi:hypothetical protein PIB30_018542 [Stylosanthes scabra]|uniref:Uncharacterized protein n=1 Tax=Stylosanthes scabra TaxID=79078 RepID=A0ABU6Z894_9FABA|nr:hypothetical protein [Stylosanthes scabra]
MKKGEGSHKAFSSLVDDEVAFHAAVATVVRAPHKDFMLVAVQNTKIPGSKVRLYSFKDVGTDNVSGGVSRWNMTSQMSPEGSRCSSPNLGPSFSTSTPSTMMNSKSLKSVKL